MSKFQQTISTVAALASIFGAGAAGYKLAEKETKPPTLDANPFVEKINQLEEKINTSTESTKFVYTPDIQPQELPQAKTSITSKESLPPVTLPQPEVPEAQPESTTTEGIEQ